MDIAIVILLTVLSLAAASPMRNADEISFDDSVAYLAQYQYMGDNNPDIAMASLTSAEQYTEALRRFQYMAGLQETGVLDEPTKAKMTQPRCGVPDVIDLASVTKRKRRYITEGGKWSRTHLTWRLERSGLTQDMNEADVVTEIERAFAVWSDNSGLTFQRIYSNTEDITIKFATYDHGDGNAFDGSGGVLAHAYFPYYGGDAHFDDSEYFTLRQYSGINLFQVAAHEFGHSLGLGHSSNQNALMAAFYAGYQPNFQLHSDDVMGIQSLYGRNVNTDNGNGNNDNDDDDNGTGGNGRPTTSTTTTTTTRPPVVDAGYCYDGRFDAVTSTDDGSTYAFRGASYFKLTTSGVETGYPVAISSTWSGVPDNVDTALYWPARRGWERCGNTWCWINEPGMTFLFNGAYVYAFVDTEYQWHDLISNAFPGLPNDLDAAFVWGRNDRTYFMKGSQYYRYPTHAARGTQMDGGYPRDLSVWWTYSDQEHQSAITHVDEALQWNQNERTYFFVGDQYYRFNDGQFRIDDGYPRSIAEWWYGCNTNGNQEMNESESDDIENTDDGNNGVVNTDDGSNGSGAMTSALSLTLTSCLVTLLSYLQ